jgi:RHS repeat-associated protein
LQTVTRNSVVSEQYGYDAVGNRTSSLGSPSWTYDDRNELTMIGTANLGYDSNGNLTSKNDSSGAWIYQWNAENQLTRVLKDTVEVARFVYDPLGRRISKTAGTTATQYLYDRQDILQVTSGASVRRLVHGPGTDEILASEIPGGASSYPHTDGLGSVVLWTDANRTPTWDYQYDSFGNIQLGGILGGFAFTGREWDAETGLYYYRARYYDPKLGRFISEDPLELTERPLQELNAYAYVANNPVNRVDPLGLQSCPPDRDADCVGQYVECRWRVLILLNVTARAACAAACAATGPIGVWKCRIACSAAIAANQAALLASCDAKFQECLKNNRGR